jgi:hypothetical protein
MKKELSRSQTHEDYMEENTQEPSHSQGECTHIVIFPAGFMPGLVMDFEKIRRMAANDEERQRKKDKKKPPKPPRRPNADIRIGRAALGNA